MCVSISFPRTGYFGFQLSRRTYRRSESFTSFAHSPTSPGTALLTYDVVVEKLAKVTDKSQVGKSRSLLMADNQVFVFLTDG